MLADPAAESAPYMPDVAGGNGAPIPGEFRAFLGLRFWDVTLERAARYLVELAAAGGKLPVFFVNAHCMNVAARDRGYAALLEDADLLCADGAGMALAARLWGQPLVNNVNGTDLFPLICSFAAARSVPIALLGARPGIAAACAERMKSRFPGLQVAWVEHGYHEAGEEGVRLDALNHSGARILFVAKGVPQQELWIASHAERLAAPVVLGVGALFDFYSGTVPRAPQRLRDLRLEWAFRLWQEPHRLFGRYVIGNPLFVLRALKQRLAGS